MSTLEQKVEVIREWLIRQAAHQRLTNPVEVQTYAGLALAEKGYRSSGSCAPISREDAFEALGVIAAQDAKKGQPMLPALVVHFGDHKPGHRFAEWAITAGLLPDPGDAGGEFIDETGERRIPLNDQISGLHAEQVAELFSAHGQAGVPDDASSLT